MKPRWVTVFAVLRVGFCACRTRRFQLRDLRHEAGSQFDEAGVPIIYVSNMLGHSNLATTSRYLNINRRGLHRALQTFEAHRTGRDAVPHVESVAHALHKDETPPQALVQNGQAGDVVQ